MQQAKANLSPSKFRDPGFNPCFAKLLVLIAVYSAMGLILSQAVRKQ